MGSKRSIIKKKVSKGAKQSVKELVSCYGKIRHTSYEAAKNANDKKIAFVKPYKCNYCPYYHVGRRSYAEKKKASK